MDSKSLALLDQTLASAAVLDYDPAVVQETEPSRYEFRSESVLNDSEVPLKSL